MTDENSTTKHGVTIMQTAVVWIRKYQLIEVLSFLFFALLSLQTQYIFAVPLVQGSPWEFGVVRVYGVEIALIGLLMWYGLRGAWQATDYGVRDRIIAVLLIFGLWILVPDGITVRSLTTWLHVSSIVGVGVLAYWTARMYGARVVLWGFVVGMVLVSLFGVYQHLAQEVPASRWLGVSEHQPEIRGDSVVQTDQERVLRAYGTLPHPNIFGGYLVAALLTLVLLFPTLRVRGKQIALMCGSFFVVVLIWTYSRSAWVAAVVVLFLAVYTMRRKKILVPKRTLLVACVVVFVAALAALPEILPRVGVAYQTHQLEQRSLNERVFSWRTAVPIFWEHLFGGTGIHRSTDALQIREPGLPGFAYQPVHNSFFLLLVELGMGGVLLLLFFVYPIVRARSFDLFLPLLIIGFFDHYLWSLFSGLALVGYWFFLIHLPEILTTEAA